MRAKTNKSLFGSGIKKFITFLFGIYFSGLPLLTFSQELSEPYELSPRITSIIDSNSRNYFYLFPGIPDFQSAQTFKLSEDVYEIRIKQKVGTAPFDTILTLGSKGFNSLRNYIEDFEIIRIKQQKLPSDIYQTPFIDLPKLEEMKKLEKKKKPDFTEVYLTNDIYVKGNLLYANEQVLSLWKESGPYEWYNIDQSVKNIDYRSINRVTVRKKGNFWKGFGLGFLIGGGAGMIVGLASSGGGGGIINPSPVVYGLAGMITLGVPSAIIGGIFTSPNSKKAEFIINGNEATYKEALLNLNKYRSFPGSKPPELNRYIKSNTKEESAQLSKTSEILKNPKIHMSFLGGINSFLQASQGDNEIMYGFDNGYLGAEISYSIREHFRAGLFYHKFPKETIYRTESRSERSPQSYGISMDYIPKPVYKYLYFSKRGEFAIGAGLSLNKIIIDDYPSFVKSNKPAAHLRCSYDYYFSQNFSMQFNSGIRIMTSVKTSQNIYNLSNKVNFSGWVLGFGLRLHI
ncbi:MAG: hypothetical protein K8S00_06215 [Bacteroidales bacterium]|nr:hypothetical protein [Bacteroidales bacterium]